MALKASLAGFAALSAFTGASAVITEDSYFYGQSPPSYPSPNTTAPGLWGDAIAKAQAAVAQLTLEEKVNLTTGVDLTTNVCSGNILPIEHIGFTGLCLSDAGNGVRNTDRVSSFPSGIHVGASWNKTLSYDRGRAMAAEFKRKGVNILLGPVVGPLGRTALSGRNWEGYSNDPYLAGSLTYDTVVGIQDAGVIATTKHFIVNEQETNRNPEGNVSSVSANVDDKTLHELYLWPFQDAVLAGTGSVMCSYNRINNSYSCQNSHLMNGVLKEELGFPGFVMSDWDALHGGYDASLAGMDMVMPDSTDWWGDNLTTAVLNGSLPEWRIDDQATRILAAWYLLGQDADFPTPGIGMPYAVALPHEKVEARDKADRHILYEGAVQGHVLVKNTNNILPLKNIETLYLSGYSATAPLKNQPVSVASLLNNGWALGSASVPEYIDSFGSFYAGETDVSPPPIAINGTLISGGGSGATSQSTFWSPYDALVARADEEYINLYWDFTSGTPEVVQSADACLVFTNAFAGEAFDRPNLHDDYTDGLILHVAATCPNTIVIMHNAGVRLVDQWIEHENVTGVIFAHLPGQDSGKALVNLLFGDEEFSGRLPYSIPKNESDYGTTYAPAQPEGDFEYFPQADFTEGVYIDYRYFDANNISTRFEFGYGLSYTSFNYSALSMETYTNVSNTGAYPVGDIVPGGASDLWDIIASVTATVSNTGSRSGAETAQLYIGIEGAPVKQLRGFAKETIPVGGSVDVTFPLTRRDLSTWDVEAQKWKLQSGSFKVSVGSSSQMLPLTGELNIEIGA